MSQDPSLSRTDGQRSPAESPLQTRTMKLAEVLENIEKWKPAWIEEYNSLFLESSVEVLRGLGLGVLVLMLRQPFCSPA